MGELALVRGTWAPAEDDAVRALYPTSSSADIAAQLNRSVTSVRNRCWTLGLNTKVVEWTDAELATLIAWYSERDGKALKLADLAAQLGRDKANVCRKARTLGLSNLRRPKKAAEEKKPTRKYSTDDEVRAAHSARMKEWHATHEHPRGAAGMKHTAKTLATLSAKSKAARANPASRHNSDENKQRLSDRASAMNIARIAAGENSYSRCAQGKRADLANRYFRSSWEANYARYLNLRIKRGEIALWDYECHTFIFEKIQRGTRAYTPDFKIVHNDGSTEWHEVKGWMDPKSVTRLKRMAKYYPAEKIVLIREPWFKAAVKGGLAATLPYWEFKAKKKTDDA